MGLGAFCMEIARQLCDSQFISLAIRSLKKAKETSVISLPIVSVLLGQAEASLGSKMKWEKCLRLEWFSWITGLVPFDQCIRVVDFYISDFQSGLRALVKTGYGARVTPYVEETIVADVNPLNKELYPEFMRWLGERNLSSDDRTMRLKEGYIKEGSTVSMMGVVQRNDNVLMIVPPPEPFTTGCQWAKCILPASLEGIVLRCENVSKIDVVPV
ncbi:hypothetical protein U1Q18_022744 [Sarracenia purpurea var. burkii]